MSSLQPRPLKDTTRKLSTVRGDRDRSPSALTHPIFASGSLRIHGAAHGELVSHDSAFFREFFRRLDGERDGYLLDEVLTTLAVAVRGLDLSTPLDALTTARFLFRSHDLSGAWPPLHPGDQVKAIREHDRDWDAVGRLEKVKDLVLRLAVHSALPSEIARHPEIRFARTVLRDEPGRPLEDQPDRCVRGFSAALSLLCARIADELLAREHVVDAASASTPVDTGTVSKLSGDGRSRQRNESAVDLVPEYARGVYAVYEECARLGQGPPPIKGTGGVAERASCAVNTARKWRDWLVARGHLELLEDGTVRVHGAP